PLAMGAVVPAYNLDEVKDKPVRFSGEVLAEIFLGKIKKWNDPKLQALQEDGVRLPDKDIAVAHRSDGSGTTYIWVDYLAKRNEEWKSGPGVGTTIKWPTGVGQKGNEGVTAYVKQTAGALGYVELIYAVQNDVKHGPVKNKEGNFIAAELKTVTAAAANRCAKACTTPGCRRNSSRAWRSSWRKSRSNSVGSFRSRCAPSKPRGWRASHPEGVTLISPGSRSAPWGDELGERIGLPRRG